MMTIYLNWNKKERKIFIIDNNSEYVKWTPFIFFDLFDKKQSGRYIVGIDNDKVVACVKVTQTNKFNLY